MPNVKGTSIAARLEYARRKGGDQAVLEILSRLSDQKEAEQLRLIGVLKSAWYPFRLFVELIEEIDRRFGKGDGALVPALAGEVAKADLKTVYKVFFKFASPNFIIEKAAQVWRRYYDSGEMVIVHNRPGDVHAEVRGFETPHRTHCLSVQGWVQQTLRMSGAADCVVTHTRCRARGEPVCEFTARWTA